MSKTRELISKISKLSQVSIILNLEADKREPDEGMHFYYYDGEFDTYTSALERAKCYSACVWACREFLQNSEYQHHLVRTNFVSRIKARLEKALAQASNKEKLAVEITPGWLEEAVNMASEFSKKADAITWEQIREVDECDQLIWQLDATDNKHCEDCVRNSKEGAKSFMEWNAQGLPGFGKTKCKKNCHCSLEPVKKLSL